MKTRKNYKNHQTKRPNQKKPYQKHSNKKNTDQNTTGYKPICRLMPKLMCQNVPRYEFWYTFQSRKTMILKDHHKVIAIKVDAKSMTPKQNNSQKQKVYQMYQQTKITNREKPLRTLMCTNRTTNSKSVPENKKTHFLVHFLWLDNTSCYLSFVGGFLTPMKSK